MNELIFKQELIENWIKILFIISTLLIIGVRTSGGKKIEFLMKFWNIHRYFIYKSGSTIPVFTTENILMFFLRVILFSIFISLYIFPLFFFESNFFNFLTISMYMALYIILKYFIEKIIAIIFNYKKKLTELNRYRIGLKNLISLHLYFYFILFNFQSIVYKIYHNFKFYIIYCLFLFLFCIYL